MSDKDLISEYIERERQEIEKSIGLHWLHWVIIFGSLALTFGAWQYAKIQVSEKIEQQFIKESDHVVELIYERLVKYEDALWAGVAAIHSQSHGIDHLEWKRFSDALRIDERYIGINGIGVIYYLPDETSKNNFLQKEKLKRPDFKIHPPHQKTEFWPITYIEPENINKQAVGLDMAHENNRFEAAKKARDTGTAQITGPIILVQDNAKTPGFLFFAPFYKDKSTVIGEANPEEFVGLVYAPFIVKKLMRGVLEKEKRHIGIQIKDGETVLYNEHVASEPDYDPDPLFKKKYEIEVYGRVWCFESWATQSFRDIANTDEPVMILIGGIIIDALILAFFLMMSRLNKKAVQFASKMTDGYQRQNNDMAKLIESLTDSNQELERFAYVAAHDMQEPLRMTANFSELIEKEHKDQLDEQGQMFLNYCREGATRLQDILDDLLIYSKIKNEEDIKEAFSTKEVVDATLGNFEDVIKKTNAKIKIKKLPDIVANPVRFGRLMQNLIGNGLKYQAEGNEPVLKIECSIEDDLFKFSIQDNGIGIKPEYQDQIFQPFKRLHNSSEYSGTGIGLAICYRIVEKMGGKLWVVSEEGQGSTFYFTIPKEVNHDK